MKIHPLRKGYNAPAPPEVVQAVRTVLADWDGANWVAVRHCIETAMPNETGLDDWTIDDIRQRFAIGQRKITIELGGRVNTTDATILPTSFAVIDVERIDLSGKPTAQQPADQADTDSDNAEAAALDCLTNQQRKIVAFLLGRKHSTTAATLKTIRGAFQYGESTEDRAVAAAVERINRRWFDNCVPWSITTQDASDSPRYKLET